MLFILFISIFWTLLQDKVCCQHFFIVRIMFRISSFFFFTNTERLRGPGWKFNLKFSLAYFWIHWTAFFQHKHAVAGYGTYLFHKRTLTPTQNTVVNIYQVSFYIQRHKELSVIGAYSRRQTSEPTWSAYMCLKPQHTYVRIFLLYIWGTLWSEWYILYWVEVRWC